MKKIIFFFMAGMMFLTAQTVFAQGYEVTGTVFDAETGETIPFASIRLNGTMTGAAAGADGTYSITVPSREDAVLTFSFMGYKSVEVAVNGRAIVDCQLEVDALALKETIVVGYGKTNREAITGSVASVDGATIASAPVVSVDKALGGKLAGVSITSTTGQPGATSQIRIRGNSSINASNSPLWVVDGIPIMTGDINALSYAQSSVITTLNPSDIESITVLKDAAAAAVYGSRAAAGVILVTTKSGQEGKAQFDVRAKYGVQWLQSDSGFRPMNGEELLDYQRTAIFNAGMDPDNPTSTYYRPKSLLSGGTWDWVKEMTQLGQIQEYEISARGGTNKATYYSSVSWQKTDGTFKSVDYTKFSARVNADFQLLKSLKTGINVNAGYTNQHNLPMQSLYYENPTWASLVVYPWISPYNPDGSYNTDISSLSNHNPLLSAGVNEMSTKTYHLNGTMFIRWEPVRNLVIETKDSAELIFSAERNYLSEDAGYDNIVDDYNRTIYQLTTSNTITYTNIFGGYHSLRALVGQEAMRSNSKAVYDGGTGVNKQIPYVNTTTDELTSVSYGFSKETMMSYFAIVDYNYDQRYFAQATVRTDGSSLFGENNKWGLFWSASGSWNLSNETWLAKHRFINLLKIRASYGVNGNNGISAYQAYGLYGSSIYNGVQGWLPSSPANEDLSWEKNATWDVGIDFGFWGRLNGQIDVYRRVTKDMLLSVSVPYTTGFGSNLRNCGSMSNTGIEFQIDGDIISTKDFYWNVGFNIAHNKNKILDLGGEDKIIAATYMHYVVGRSMYSYYLADYYGVNPSTGEALWVADVAEDGHKILTSDYSKARWTYTNAEAKVTGGFNTTFSWKGLSLAAYFEYKAGNYVWQVNESYYLMSDGNQMGMNQLASMTKYWKNPGDTGVNPKPVANNSSNSNYATSNRWLQRGDYIRIKDVTLAYAFQPNVLDKIRLKGLRVYVSGLNLYCFNDVDYWDPDLGTYGFVTGGIYPTCKSFVGGIEITF